MLPPRGLTALVVSVVMATPSAPAAVADVQQGIALVDQGDFEAAVVALDAALRDLEGRPGTDEPRAQANLYLGVAYLELEQEVTSRAKFREALRLQPTLRLDPERFSAQVIRTFEAVRLEAATTSAPPAAAGPKAAPSPRTPAGAPMPSPSPAERRKRSALPYILVGGGAAAAGVAIAASGGSSPSSTTLIAGGATTTTTTPGGSATTTTTTTTSTSSTSPAPATTTTTTSPPPPTTTTPPAPACSYDASPGSQQVPAGGADGSCQISAPGGCGWSAEADRDWLHITSGGSGSGSGSVRFHADANTDKNSRDGRIRLRNTVTNTDARCDITQGGTGGFIAAEGLSWTSTLDVAGGRGQVVLDGATGAVHARAAQRAQRLPGGLHRIEATLLEADGHPGTWRFELAGTVEPGSVQVIAGDVLALTGDSVAFRLAGRAGERLAFAFQTR